VSNAGNCHHEVAIAGRVLDAVTGKPMAGADVAIATMPNSVKQRLKFAASAYGKQWEKMLERPDRTQSRPDGLFYFLDLPDGDYTLRISMPSLGSRFGKLEMPTKVSRDAGGNVTFGLLRCALPPTSVKGKVTGLGQESGVPLARVRVKGSGERAFTDSQGQYVVAGIEPGKKRTLLVSAQGYGTKSKEFALLEPGSAKKVDFELTRENG
jgi:CarboxypepD_reg-like domain/Carboxypeptidase regulatory-like domain